MPDRRIQHKALFSILWIKAGIGLRDERILLVDGEKGIITMLELLLKKEGFVHIATAATGQEAMAQVETASFDLIVLNVMLPDTDGFGLCQQIRRSTGGADSVSDRTFGRL